MDENFLKNLEKALSLSPDNLSLRFSIIEAYLNSNQYHKALALLEEAGGQFNEVEHQLLAAKLFLALDRPQEALDVATINTPQIELVRAKAHYRNNDTDAARVAYHNAVTDSAELEDIELAKSINYTSPLTTNSRDVKLRVISNDNTDTTEVTRLIQPTSKKITFSDIGGLEGVKKQIHKKIISPFQKPKLFEKFRKKVGGGILLYGPPGCGKTLLARATAGECNAKFYNVVISDILDMYIGESEKKLHAIFEKARENTPSVIFFDEIEALASKRQHTREATSSKLVSQFLSELDGFAQDNKGVLVLGATNVPWALDPAFRRPGRFDRVVFVAPPDKDARTEILSKLLEDRPVADSVDIEFIAKATSGFSGADLMNLVDNAVDDAIDDSIQRGTEVPLNKTHFSDAMDVTKSTTLEWLTMARNYAKYANESGQYDEVITFLNKHGKR